MRRGPSPLERLGRAASEVRRSPQLGGDGVHEVKNACVHDFFRSLLDSRLYAFEVEIDLLLRNPAYPKEPKTFGECIRKVRMEKGLLIRELAALVGVSADTVINWELRGVKPMGERLKRLREALEGIASALDGP